MGWNEAWTIVEAQIVGIYDLGALTLPVLDVLCEPFRGTDIDSGGSRDLTAKDGKDLAQIVVELINPEFKPDVPADGAEWDYSIHWDWYDEFRDITENRWDWR